MMPSVVGASVLQIISHEFSCQPATDECSRQLVFNDTSRRMPRVPNVQRTNSTMRVVKPSSANNSPQAMMARRRTLMNDNTFARRRQQALDQALLQQMQDTSVIPYINHYDPARRSHRPVSWHPSSHLQQQQQQYQQMHMPIPHPDYSQYATCAAAQYPPLDLYSGYSPFPPTPAAYSGQTSPNCRLSPLSLPFAASAESQSVPAYVSRGMWNPTPQHAPNTCAASGSPGTTEPFPLYTSQASYDWGTVAGQGFDTGTAPPTPDEYQPLQQHQSVVPSEESIPYEPLEEPEEEGEILVGMGLYDPPNKTETDPELDNYRTTASQLLGTTYRIGQGWKLEEAWEPPVTEDENDDDEETDDGERQDQKDRTRLSPPATEQIWI